jgi:hypothetical protein
MLSIESLKLFPVQLRHLLAASRTNAVFLDKETLLSAHKTALDLVEALLDATTGLRHQLLSQQDYTVALSAQVDDLEQSIANNVIDVGTYENEIASLKSRSDAEHSRANFNARKASEIHERLTEQMKVAALLERENRELKAMADGAPADKNRPYQTVQEAMEEIWQHIQDNPLNKARTLLREVSWSRDKYRSRATKAEQALADMKRQQEAAR